MLKEGHTHTWGLEITQNASIFQLLFHIAGHLLNSVIWMALMASVYYGILCCCCSTWMLELAIQGDVCKDGVIETKETHIKVSGFSEWVWRCTYVHTFLYVLVSMSGGVKKTSRLWTMPKQSELFCKNAPPLNHPTLPSLVGSAFWENSSVERRFRGAVFWGVGEPYSCSCPWSQFLHLLSIWYMFVYG